MASLGMRFFGNLEDWLDRRRVFACCGTLLAIEIGVFLFLVAGTHGLIVPLSQPTSTDFVSFYAAGSLADAGKPELAYDHAEHYAAEERATAVGVEYRFFYYPPVFLLLCAALARLPYMVAFLVFEAATLALYLIVARGIAEDWFIGLDPAELCAVLVMLVAEDRGREQPASRRRFPTPRVEHAWRVLRSEHARLAALEADNGLQTLRPLSMDFVTAAYHWARGRPLAEIEPPPGGDVGDVVKAVKNLYSMLRQVEQVVRHGPLRAAVVAARELVERDMIRRV